MLTKHEWLYAITLAFGFAAIIDLWLLNVNWEIQWHGYALVSIFLVMVSITERKKIFKKSNNRRKIT